MTTTDKLKKLNELHTTLGRGTFKSWKQSVAKLDAKITAAQAEVDLANTEPAEQSTSDNELPLMLDRYNELRKVMGYKIVTSWKGTRDELASAMTKLKQDHLEMIRSENAHMTRKPKSLSIPSLTKVTKPKKVIEVTKPTTSFLPGLCAELGLNQKVARTKLRKAYTNWRTLTVKEVREFLTKKAR